eukprot:TRINITY_DN1819_c0_g4_i1.p1 TRINITY_DN1819_c0_g4~~TRINITY_DN1819_c0_g4_i1.p1  ORF type:complete len:474 (-),score=76.00 TRINITY_DN1819_c0_g4_i1:278-1636(-)
MIDFGTSNDFDSRSKLFKMTATLSNKITGYTPAYCPPEVLRESKGYVLNKMDVYCWGMTIYQLITNRSCSELENEAASFKLPGKNYEGFLELVRKIRLTGDPGNEITEWMAQVLLTVLDEDPAKRPNFTELRKKFENRVKLEDAVTCKAQLLEENKKLKELLEQKEVELNYEKSKVKSMERLCQLKEKVKECKADLAEVTTIFESNKKATAIQMQPMIAEAKKFMQRQIQFYSKIVSTIKELRISIDKIKKVITAHKFDKELANKLKQAFNTRKKIKVLQKEAVLRSSDNFIVTECCKVSMHKDLIKNEIINLNRIDIINNLAPVCSKCYKPLSKSVLTQAITAEEFKERCSRICCYCGSKETASSSNCAYHFVCSKCKSRPGSECGICKVFSFRRIEIQCCNCNSLVDLPLTRPLICGHSICHGCYDGSGNVVCNLCVQERISLHVILIIL